MRAADYFSFNCHIVTKPVNCKTNPWYFYQLCLFVEHSLPADVLKNQGKLYETSSRSSQL